MNKTKLLFACLIAVGTLHGNAFAGGIANNVGADTNTAQTECVAKGGTWIELLGLCVNI